MEEGDDSSFELTWSSYINSDGTEWLPKNSLTDIGGNEEWNCTSQSVSFLE